MPIYEYLCLECQQQNELLVNPSSAQPTCRSCGSANLKKLLSAHTTLSSTSDRCMAGPGDTPCCGPGQQMPAGCPGPGSCGERCPS